MGLRCNGENSMSMGKTIYRGTEVGALPLSYLAAAGGSVVVDREEDQTFLVVGETLIETIFKVKDTQNKCVISASHR